MVNGRGSERPEFQLPKMTESEMVVWPTSNCCELLVTVNSVRRALA